MRAELHCLILLTIFSFTARDIPLHSSSSRDVVTGPSARFRFINYARMRRFSDPGRGGGLKIGGAGTIALTNIFVVRI